VEILARAAGAALVEALSILPAEGYGVRVGGNSAKHEVAMRTVSCHNSNHGRPQPPVRFCPRCGEIVNDGITAKSCSQMTHAQKRQHREVFCVDCGERLTT
jgi:hypothetical protein